MSYLKLLCILILFYIHSCISQLLQQATVNPITPTQNGISITYNEANTKVSDSYYNISVTTQNEYDVAISLQDEWSFKSTTTTLIITVNGITPNPTADTDFIIIFAVDNTQFFSFFVHLDDSKVRSKIYPSKKLAIQQDVLSLLQDINTYPQRWDRVSNGDQWITTKPRYNGQANWPLQFEITNNISSNKCIFSYYNQANTYQTGNTFNDTFMINKPMNIYIMGDTSKEQYQILDINIQLHLHNTNLIQNIVTVFPTKTPTLNPTKLPSQYPTKYPSQNPTIRSPTFNPIKSTTNIPSIQPSISPINTPTNNPLHSPSQNPTIKPTINPTIKPTINPTIKPTINPTKYPTQNPSFIPTILPSIYPSQSPTIFQLQITKKPTTLNPSNFPTINPSNFPTITPTLNPTITPTFKPTSSISPTQHPSRNPTEHPSLNPTYNPITNKPTNVPTISPSIRPTLKPTRSPLPVDKTNNPSNNPTKEPTNNPTILPTNMPTNNPTIRQKKKLSISPTYNPSNWPTLEPTLEPTLYPIYLITNEPTQKLDNEILTDQAHFSPGSLSNWIVFSIFVGVACCAVSILLTIAKLNQNYKKTIKKRKSNSISDEHKLYSYAKVDGSPDKKKSHKNGDVIIINNEIIEEDSKDVTDTEDDDTTESNQNSLYNKNVLGIRHDIHSTTDELITDKTITTFPDPFKMTEMISTISISKNNNSMMQFKNFEVNEYDSGIVDTIEIREVYGRNRINNRINTESYYSEDYMMKDVNRSSSSDQ